MLIVSQDKKTVLNLDRITEIVADDNEITVTDSLSMTYGEVIATYGTAERAQKVLEEIIGRYRNFNTDDNKSVTLRPKIYEMPKE